MEIEEAGYTTWESTWEDTGLIREQHGAWKDQDTRE